jgi:1,4-dihydroxy-2-naphthoate octaprenyltransferase
VLTVWLSFPFGLRLVRAIYQPVDGPRLNKALGETMVLDLFISLAFAAGLLIGRV